jgi:hypothetical protein
MVNANHSTSWDIDWFVYVFTIKLVQVKAKVWGALLVIVCITGAIVEICGIEMFFSVYK